MTHPIFELPRLVYLLAQVTMLSANITPQGALMTLYARLDVPFLCFSKAILLPFHTLTIVCKHIVIWVVN